MFSLCEDKINAREATTHQQQYSQWVLVLGKVTIHCYGPPCTKFIQNISQHIDAPRKDQHTLSSSEIEKLNFVFEFKLTRQLIWVFALFPLLELWKNFLVCNFCKTRMEFDRKGEFKWGKLEKGNEGGIEIGGKATSPKSIQRKKTRWLCISTNDVKWKDVTRVVF